jgi:hypothetical protein
VDLDATIPAKEFSSTSIQRNQKQMVKIAKENMCVFQRR